MPARGVVARLEELRVERGVDRKRLAGFLKKTRQAVDAALRGRTNMTVSDAEVVAEHLGATLEVVVRRDPVDDFRRSLDANRDLPPVLRDAIWTLFERGKLEGMRAGPKKGDAGSSRSSRGRPA
jgi:transcriptional regulator with XRE-family HTH domain